MTGYVKKQYGLHRICFWLKNRIMDDIAAAIERIHKNAEKIKNFKVII